MGLLKRWPQGFQSQGPHSHKMPTGYRLQLVSGYNSQHPVPALVTCLRNIILTTALVEPLCLPFRCEMFEGLSYVCLTTLLYLSLVSVGVLS